MRVYCSSGFRGVGFDEHAYTVFLTEIEKSGALNYDLVMRVCLERQQRTADAIVPATRVGFLLPAYAVAEVFQVSPFVALRYLNCGAAILTLLITLAFSYRALGMGAMLGIGCLMATSPLAIHLSQRALVDGYFSLWATTAVWLAWENLRCPRHLGWLAAYFASLVLLVLTKESAAFVVVGLCAVLLWYGLQGCCPWRLWVATMAGPVVAIAVLATLTGGITKLVQFYYVFESKSGHNIYSVMAQDGPWYRYLIDFILLSPLITTFALGAIFHLRRSVDTALAIFLGASFVVMSAVSHGMSLRYAAYWELPLCWLAFLQVELLAEKVRRNWRPFAIAGMVVLLSATNLWQYQRLFVAGEIYDPISFQLARATHLIK
ncbi:MAG: hypothetical protein JO354_12200 [Verrucomicrobia bacterium]|nr:hypothetical protein [Verrucomicrobiota bacterium]